MDTYNNNNEIFDVVIYLRLLHNDGQRSKYNIMSIPLKSLTVFKSITKIRKLPLPSVLHSLINVDSGGEARLICLPEN